MVRNLRLAAVMLALTAMLLRALLPAGFMPGVAAGGSSIVVCTMDGLVRIALDADGKPVKKQPAQDDAHHQQLCPFAAAVQLASPSSAGALIAPSHAFTLALDVLPQSRLAAFEGHRAQSPRAPPFA